MKIAVPDLAATIAAYGEREITLELSAFDVGMLHRRNVRAAFDLARVAGADVEVYEQKGFLDSRFAARVEGRADAILPMLIALDRLTANA